jgi:general secretion pathway protein I
MNRSLWSQVVGSQARAAFTLVEVLVALCIVLIALVPLLQLHVVSIDGQDSATRLAHAVDVAQEVMAEVAGAVPCELGTRVGQAQPRAEGDVYDWRATVEQAEWSGLRDINLDGLRRIEVVVTWRNGIRARQVSLCTWVYVSISSVPARATES